MKMNQPESNYYFQHKFHFPPILMRYELFYLNLFQVFINKTQKADSIKHSLTLET